jgi:hypothetical protein
MSGENYIIRSFVMLYPFYDQIKNEMGGDAACMREITKANKTSVSKHPREEASQKIKCRWEVNINMDRGTVRTDIKCPRLGVNGEGSCRYNNEPQSSIEGREFLE